MSYTYEAGPGMAARMLTRATRATIRPALRLGCQLSDLPWPFDAVELLAKVLPSRSSHDKSIVQLRYTTATLLTPPTYSPDRVILYLHGGAFLTCGPNTHSSLIGQLADNADCPVLAVDYRMFPKSSLGQAVGDCLEAYLWLRERYGSDEIVIAGDSAGGYLALTVAIKLAWLMHETPVAGLALMSPLLRLDPVDRNRHPNIDCDAMFDRSAFLTLYSLAERANRGAGIYEPLDHLLAPMPPMVVHVSGHEALLHDTHELIAAMGGIGLRVDVHVWPGQIHVFQMAHRFLPEARQSLRQLGDFVKSVTEKEKILSGNT